MYTEAFTKLGDIFCSSVRIDTNSFFKIYMFLLHL